MKKYILVRSPNRLIKENKIGIGWNRVNFSEFGTAKEVIEKIKQLDPSFSRARNKVTRFFNLKKDDIVIVPGYKCIYLATVSGEKSYDTDLSKDNAANQIAVEFLRQEDGKPIRFSRSLLQESLERRLKTRHAVADLGEFSQLIDELIIKKSDFSLQEDYLHHVEKELDDFKEKLSKRLKNGNTRLDSGGLGLERLVKELLECEGYDVVDLPAKNNPNSKGVADIDVIAQSSSSKFLPTLLIQVKHHSGTSSAHAIRQLAEYDYDDSDDLVPSQRWMITTAKVGEDTQQKAQIEGVHIMTGETFAQWLCERLYVLSDETKARLGVAITPSFMA